jgi:hypothetical protein
MLDNFYLELLQDKVFLYNFNPMYKKEILGFIVPILLDEHFFNITQNESEYSIFLSTKHCKEIEKFPYLNKAEDEYSILRIYQNEHGINEHGIVYQLSKLFYEKSIPILYINSFNNNYILLPTKHLDELHEWIEM